MGQADRHPGEIRETRFDSRGGLSLVRLSHEAAGKPVIIAHGMFASHRSVRPLALHLARGGRDVWMFDFRGHGASAAPARSEDFEAAALRDAAEALGEVRVRTGRSVVDWVGHSGGGLAILMLLARHPDRRSDVGSVVCVASQATHACAALLNRCKVAGILMSTVLLRRMPGHLLGVGTEPEGAAIMRQWCLWNLRGRWTGSDGFDYLEALAEVHAPTLCMAGEGDDFIAPPAGCVRIRQALPCSSSIVCGPATGFSERYSHARIIRSKAATREVWPLVQRWLDDAEQAGYREVAAQR